MNNYYNILTSNNNNEKNQENELNINMNKNKNENNKKEEEIVEIEEDEEDNREIYKMFEDKLYQNEPTANDIKPQQIKMNKDKPIPINSIKNQQSRLMNKYFGNALNNLRQNQNNTNYVNNKKNNNKQKSKNTLKKNNINKNNNNVNSKMD